MPFTLLTHAQRHPLWQPAIYLIVGGWNTVFGVGLYALLYFLIGHRINYFVLMIPCNILAITNAYVCYKLFVFRTRGNWLREYLRFYVVYGAAMLIGMALVVLFVQVFHMHPVLASIWTTGITVVCSFIGHKRISFAPGP
jgi:putative flippase GtrA